MKKVEKLFNRVLQRVNINLREIEFDANPWVAGVIPIDQFGKFYAFYGISSRHPLDLSFAHSSVAGSYFLGKCRVNNSILYKTDIRGDELKSKGDAIKYQDFEIVVNADEMIRIEDSFLIKNLVHNCSHDPENLEEFNIQNTCSMHYANIHGSPTEGCFLGPFSTIDLTSMQDSVIGSYSYIQAGEVLHMNINPGTIWVHADGDFNFLYEYPQEILEHYVSVTPGQAVSGIFMDFIEARKADFQRVFDVVNLELPFSIPNGASLDRFAVIKPKITLNENVLVSQRAYLENSWLGKGANAQENCYIINSKLMGNNVTAHGAKIINADMGTHVFVGFNSFLNGKPGHRLNVGSDCIVMPHTIIDLEEPVAIPDGHLVWGHISRMKDLETQTYPISKFAEIKDGLILGRLLFEGDGKAFVDGFKARIHHILEANGAFYDGSKNHGHAQNNQNISINTIQPYSDGELEGLYPTIRITP
ncbi:MAG: transferase [Desulfobacteraceae bacterium]|nr:transferase [Desulfobacteraceae bacterium]